MVNCIKCVNRGRVRGLSQESYCSGCVHGTPWKKDYYSEGAVGGVPHKNCDGCARDLPVIDGIHRDGNKAVMTCTAKRYT